MTGLLVSLNHFADNKNLFLKNFYLKSKRSILKAKTEGPAAYVFPADDPRPGLQADLLRIMQLQGCEISRATAPFTVMVPGRRRPAREMTNDAPATNGNGSGPSAQTAPEGRQGGTGDRDKPVPPETRTFPAGTYVLRMDQPYSRIADMLLDHQYWAPDDPQRNPYDDTGWTFGELFNVRVVRVVDIEGARREDGDGQGRAHGSGRRLGDGHDLRDQSQRRSVARRAALPLQERAVRHRRRAVRSLGQKFNRGSFIVQGVAADALGKAATELGLNAVALTAAPSVKTHPARAARVALMHTWINTQDEGWWRLALDQIGVPFTYISTQDVTGDGDLRGEVRRHPLPADRPCRRAADHQRLADVRQSRCRGRTPS